jgi:hypothetical protein
MVFQKGKLREVTCTGSLTPSYSPEDRADGGRRGNDGSPSLNDIVAKGSLGLRPGVAGRFLRALGLSFDVFNYFSHGLGLTRCD